MNLHRDEVAGRPDPRRPPHDLRHGDPSPGRRRADLERLRLLREAEHIAGLGSWEWSPDTGRLVWSESLYRIFGLDPDARMDFERYVSLLHPDDRDAVLEIVGDLRESGGRASFEHRIVRSDGETRWLSCRAESVRSDPEQDVRLVGTARDVTAERRAAETEALYDRERRARAEAEAAAARIRFLNEVGQALSSSLDEESAPEVVARLSVPRFADWCVADVVADDGSVRRAAVLHRDERGESAARAVCEDVPSDRASARPAQRAFTTREPVLLSDVESDAGERGARSTGLIRTLGTRSVVAAPLVARDRVLGSLTFGLGDSGRRYGEADENLARELAARTALAMHNARLYRSARTSAAAAERRATDEEALRVAAEALARTETVEEVTSRIVESAIRATSADGAVVERLMPDGTVLETVAGAGAFTLPIGVSIPFRGSLARHVLDRGEPLVHERLSEAGSGVSRELKRACGECATIAVPLSSGGESLGALFLLRGRDQPPFRPEDAERARSFGELSAVALRKARLLEQAEQRREALERVMESRSRLMQAFTHDVKNPLGAAASHARLLLEQIRGPLTEDQRDSVERIGGSIDSALELIGDILELSRAESGRISIEWSPVDVRDLAAEVVREHRAEAEAGGLELSLTAPAPLPAVETDGARVRQILSNLLSNAIKYTANGSVEVILDEPAGESGSDDEVLVAVRDSGPGVSEEEKEMLFREFSRIGSPDAPGTGLGLVISRRIARLLGGDIGVESEPGEGSTFTLRIPVSAPAGRVDDVEEPPLRSRAADA